MDNSSSAPGAHPRTRIITFLVLTLVLSSIFCALIIGAGSLNAGGGIYTLALMWCPGVAALITTFAYQRNLRGLGWGLGKARYLAIAYALPILYTLLVYPLVWLTGLGGFTPENSLQMPLALFLVVTATLGMVQSIISALGEEIGWRGLLVPQLARITTPARTALISGGIWLLWHVPLILFADYNNGTAWWYALGCFGIMVMGVSFMATWLRLKSGSLWPAVILHAAHNLFVQAVFDALTVQKEATPYVTGEFGIGLALVGVLLVVVLWRVWPVTAPAPTRPAGKLRPAPA